MGMYEKAKYRPGRLVINESKQGETLETKIERAVAGKEKLGDDVPLMYTERKDGVKASTNIRTDRFSVAIEGMDKVEKSYKAKREERHKKKDVGGPESTQGETKVPVT